MKVFSVDGIPKWLIALGECVFVVERKVLVKERRLRVSRPPLWRHLRCREIGKREKSGALAGATTIGERGRGSGA